MRFSIISCGWMCEKYINDWYDSLKRQSGDWHAFVVDDGSKDRTHFKLSQIKDGRITLFRNEQNRGAAFSRWELLKHVPQDSVVIQLDLDDWLIGDVISAISPHYERGKLMTLGSFRVTKGSFKNNGFYSREQIEQNTFHKDKLFKCPPLRTFHGSLVSAYTREDFQLASKWLRSCTDVALMWPLLRVLSYDQVAFIREPLYMYRRRLSVNSSGRVRKGPIFNELRRRYG